MKLITSAIALLSFAGIAHADDSARPNIIWFVVEDASAHIGCYGETTIETPNIDRLATEGVRFTQTFVTCPVCSPSRSAMVTGMYQTTIGSHNHRSQRANGQGNGTPDFVASYGLSDEVPLVPTLFHEAGYYVANGGNAKTDYNFVHGDLYDARDWAGRAEGQPFFAQIQARGGKFRNAPVDNPVDPADVVLPPYYPDHPVIREDWARYLNSWLFVDQEIGELLARLEDEGTLDSTVIFFWTDHGISHARGKQFLYDEGIHVPLIVRFPDGRMAATERDDLTLQIDVAATSLALAGIEIPGIMQGRDLFADDYHARRTIFTARDRCDETVDIIRSARTDQFKYIRNFLPQYSHMQPNQYKDGKDIVQIMRELHAAGQLTALQDRIFAPTRPIEELYDLEADPWETHNLLVGTMDEQRATRDTANALRLALYQWMIDSGDMGLFPEPILEDLGRIAGSKYAAMQRDDRARLMWRIIDTIEAGDRRDIATLRRSLTNADPTVRWWAATGLGLAGDTTVIDELSIALEDEFAGVQVAAALSLAQLGEFDQSLEVLAQHLDDDNGAVTLFAMNALETRGRHALPVLPAIESARESPFVLTTWSANRTFELLQAP